jgi:hypothetical protein
MTLDAEERLDSENRKRQESSVDVIMCSVRLSCQEEMPSKKTEIITI